MLEPPQHRGRRDAGPDDLERDPPSWTLLLGLVDDAHRAFTHEGEDAEGSDAIRMGGRRRRRLSSGASVVLHRSILRVVHETSGPSASTGRGESSCGAMGRTLRREAAACQGKGVGCGTAGLPATGTRLTVRRAACCCGALPPASSALAHIRVVGGNVPALRVGRCPREPLDCQPIARRKTADPKNLSRRSASLRYYLVPVRGYAKWGDGENVRFSGIAA